MLNASLARFYNLEFWVIHPVSRQPKRLSILRFGKDSWVFDHPRQQSSVFLGMATRADVYLDFRQLIDRSDFADFQKDGKFDVFLVSTLNQKDGRGPGHGDNDLTAAEFPRGMEGNLPDNRGTTPLLLMKFIVQTKNQEGPAAAAPVSPSQPAEETGG